MHIVIVSPEMDQWNHQDLSTVMHQKNVRPFSIILNVKRSSLFYNVIQIVQFLIPWILYWKIWWIYHNWLISWQNLTKTHLQVYTTCPIDINCILYHRRSQYKSCTCFVINFNDKIHYSMVKLQSWTDFSVYLKQ